MVVTDGMIDGFRPSKRLTNLQITPYLLLITVNHGVMVIDRNQKPFIPNRIKLPGAARGSRFLSSHDQDPEHMLMSKTAVMRASFVDATHGTCGIFHHHLATVQGFACALLNAI